MSKRSEEAALKAYPDSGVDAYSRGRKKTYRQKYIEGYEQAEKDLALTPEDVVVITTLYECGRVRGWTIEEVLRRFNEQRNKK